MIPLRRIGVLIALLLASAGLRGETIEVPGDYPTIQAAIDAARDGDLVLVSDGVYYEQINFSGKAITVASHHLVDGDIAHIDNTVIDGSQAPDPLRASVVYFESGEDSTSVLHGLTITGGTGTRVVWGVPDIVGGGVLLNNAGGTLRRNVIRNNTAINSGYANGGGVAMGPMDYTNHYVVLEGNTIRDNFISGYVAGYGGVMVGLGRIEDNIISGNRNESTSNAYGGGIGISSNNPMGVPSIVRGNVIQGNHAVSSGRDAYSGGLEIYGRNALVTNNIITGNTLQGRNTYGCGMSVSNLAPSATIEISGNQIAFNRILSGTAYGGGIYLLNANAIVAANRITDNSAQWGGGIFALGNAAGLKVVNNLFARDSANYGGAMNLRDGKFALINNSILNNDGTNTGGGILLQNNAEMVLFNGILWGNTAPTGPQIHVAQGQDTVLFTTVEGGWTGGTDIFTEPPCFDSTGYHLAAGSPCTGRGVESVVIGGVTHYAPDDDIDGQPRPMPAGTHPDLGAAEEALTAIEPVAPAVATIAILHPAYPNPFNPRTTIAFEIPAMERVRVTVYDLLGRKVAVLVDDALTAGRYAVTWNAGERASGLYFCRMEAGTTVQTQRLLLVR